VVTSKFELGLILCLSLVCVPNLTATKSFNIIHRVHKALGIFVVLDMTSWIGWKKWPSSNTCTENFICPMFTTMSWRRFLNLVQNFPSVTCTNWRTHEALNYADIQHRLHFSARAAIFRWSRAICTVYPASYIWTFRRKLPLLSSW